MATQQATGQMGQLAIQRIVVSVSTPETRTTFYIMMQGEK